METEIRDQVYDVKNGNVTITILCCNPEKIRDKFCCKGGKVIKNIQIVDDPLSPQKPREAEKHKPSIEEPKVRDAPVPVQGYPPMPMYPNGTCCGPCSEGYGGGHVINGTDGLFHHLVHVTLMDDLFRYQVQVTIMDMGTVGANVM